MDRLTTRKPVDWVLPVIIVTAAQAVVAMMTRALPLFGVPLTLAAGMDPTAAGQMASATSLGSMVFFLWGPVLVAGLGALGQIRCGIVLTALAIGLCLFPDWRMILLGAFLIGVGYGPSAPAGSDLLMRIVPATRRHFVFSLKQAGVPFGGLMAGLLLPVIGLMAGVPAALLTAAGIALFMAWVLGFGRIQLDESVPAPTRGAARVSEIFFAPLFMARMVLETRKLRSLTFVGVCLAASQGVLLAYYPVLLVEGAGWSLTAAGAAFAVLQGVGIAGRVLMGWLTDRTGNGDRMLSWLGLTSGATLLAMAATGQGTPAAVVLVLAALAGITVISWNGIYLTELALAAPEGQVGTVTAAGTLVLFSGYVVSPLLAQVAMAGSGSYALAFLLTGCIPIVAVGIAALCGSRGNRGN